MRKQSFVSLHIWALNKKCLLLRVLIMKGSLVFGRIVKCLVNNYCFFLIFTFWANCGCALKYKMTKDIANISLEIWPKLDTIRRQPHGPWPYHRVACVRTVLNYKWYWLKTITDIYKIWNMKFIRYPQNQPELALSKNLLRLLWKFQINNFSLTNFTSTL